MEDPTGSAISGPPVRANLAARAGPSLPRRPDPSRPAGTRRPVSRSRRPRRGPRSSRSCLMPGIIRCPESAAIQAGNPDHRGPRRGTRRFCLQRGSRVRVSGRRGQRSHKRCRRRPAQRSLCAAGAEAVVAADGCQSAGRYRCAGRRPAVMAARRVAARMLAVSPAGIPAVLALPRDHGGHRLACGGLAQGRFAAGVAHDGGLVLWRAGPGCRSRRVSLAGRGAWPPGPGLAGPPARHT